MFVTPDAVTDCPEPQRGIHGERLSLAVADALHLDHLERLFDKKLPDVWLGGHSLNVRRDCPYHGGARISVPRISVHSLSDHRVPANDATAIAGASRHTKHVSHPQYRCPLGNSASDTMWEASTIVIAI